MKTFKQDMADYVSGNINKKQFVENVLKGVGTNDNNGAYGIEAGNRHIHYTSEFSSEFHREMSYAEYKLMVEAFDAIIYSKERPEAIPKHETGSLLFEGYYAQPTRASCLALEAMHQISLSRSGSAAIENFYQEQGRKVREYSLSRYGSHNGILNYEYALCHEIEMTDNRLENKEAHEYCEVMRAKERIKLNREKKQEALSGDEKKAGKNAAAPENTNGKTGNLQTSRPRSR